MDIWKKYTSPLGYQTGNGKIDSYGVNHSGFSLQDEVAYQMARNKREQQMIQNYNNQGITKNYPQAGIGFWGNLPDNNYGFGTSNISGNIDNVTNLLKQNEFNNVSANVQNYNTPQSSINRYLVPKEAYKDPSWGQQTAAKLDNYMQNYNSYPGQTQTGLTAPFYDMWRNYKTMMDEQRWEGGDNFFHCKANYETAKRGLWGELVAKAISAGREIYGLAKGDPLSDIRKDWHANCMGWKGAKNGLPLQKACPTNPRAYVNIKDYKDIF